MKRVTRQAARTAPMAGMTSMRLVAVVALMWIALAAIGCKDKGEDGAARKAGDPPMIPIRNAVISHGYLLGGAPTPEQLEEAAAKGYKRIIDLRGTDEKGVAAEREQLAKLGVSYVSLPVTHASGPSETNARAFADLLDQDAQDAGPTMIHCSSGNRVGAMMALAAFYVDKKPPAQALKIGKKAGLTRWEPKVRSLLGLPGE